MNKRKIKWIDDKKIIDFDKQVVESHNKNWAMMLKKIKPR